MLPCFDPQFFVLFAQAGGLLAQAEGGGGNGVSPGTGLLSSPLTLIIILGLMFYLLVLRPENRRRAEMQKLLTNVKKNDEVITVGGIYGVVVNAPQDSEYLWLRLDETSNTRVKVLRSSISRVLTAEALVEKGKKSKEKSEVKE
jgi:preprotein translocase subunit YajC